MHSAPVQLRSAGPQTRHGAACLGKTGIGQAQRTRQHKQTPQPQSCQRQQHTVPSQRCSEATHGKGQKKTLCRTQQWDQSHTGGTEPEQKRQQRIPQVGCRRGQYGHRLLRAAVRQLGVALDVGAQLRQRVGADAPARRIRRLRSRRSGTTRAFLPKMHKPVSSSSTGRQASTGTMRPALHGWLMGKQA